jgi:hypothetical protein
MVEGTWMSRIHFTPSPSIVAWLGGEDEAGSMSSALGTVLTVYDRADRFSISVQTVYLPVDSAIMMPN